MNDECLGCVARKFCDYEEPEKDWTCEYRESMEQEYYKRNGIYDKEQKSGVNVVEVRHGRWELDKHGGLICSECQNRALYLETGWYFNLHIKQMESVYCPYCGAKMDGKE